eukprot:1674559-Pleurochrysis_carterae.AAC.1
MPPSAILQRQPGDGSGDKCSAAALLLEANELRDAASVASVAAAPVAAVAAALLLRAPGDGACSDDERGRSCTLSEVRITEHRPPLCALDELRPSEIADDEARSDDGADGEQSVRVIVGN